LEARILEEGMSSFASEECGEASGGAHVSVQNFGAPDSILLSRRSLSGCGQLAAGMPLGGHVLLVTIRRNVGDVEALENFGRVLRSAKRCCENTVLLGG
jgi:hypothetical protein